GRFGILVLCLAWILGLGAFADTAMHLGLPRLKATESRLKLTRSWLIPPKLKDDFDRLVQTLQKETKGTEGITIGALLEHLELADYNGQLVNWKIDPGLYREFVLSPRIEPSTIHYVPSTDSNWRRPLWENFYPRIRREGDPAAAAQIVVRFLRERVTVVPGSLEYHGIRAIWESERTDAAGFEKIYVAALRSVGIPARLNEAGQAELFSEQGWLPAPRPVFSILVPPDRQLIGSRAPNGRA
ncbi:MAG: transglutaminase domain-containing protein, partial [Verrucomicrobiota bacterium]